jgi:hypothetical protein
LTLVNVYTTLSVLVQLVLRETGALPVLTEVVTSSVVDDAGICNVTRYSILVQFPSVLTIAHKAPWCVGALMGASMVSGLAFINVCTRGPIFSKVVSRIALTGSSRHTQVFTSSIVEGAGV